MSTSLRNSKRDNESMQPPTLWTRILRRVVRREEAEHVEDTLAELYQLRRLDAPGTEDAWYRRQVLGFVVRLPTLGRRGRGLAVPRGLFVDRLLQDLRFAIRQMRRRPIFALFAVLTSGVGVGAATAIFSIVRSVVLEPLPFPAADQLVDVLEVNPHGDDFVTSEPNFLDFQARNRSLSDLAAWQAMPVAARLGDEAVQLSAVRASASFFSILGETASLGRVFTDAEADADPEPVTVLSHHLWRDAFAAEKDVLGRSVRIDGVGHTVIGVMPPDWQPLASADLWLPQQLREHGGRDDHILNMVGRLAKGHTTTSARADLMRIQRDLAARYPESNAGWGIDVRSLKVSFIGEETIRAGWMLLGAVGLLLLLACASVSNLLIARSTDRRREMGIRNALGASPARVAQQVGTESIILALAGGALGVILAYAAIPVLQAVAPPDTPRIGDTRVDVIVLLFSTVAALSAGLLFGSAPVMYTVGTDVRTALLHGGRGTTGGGERIREVLVVAQVAVAFTLIAGVGLLGTTFLRLQAQDPGLIVDSSLAVPLTLPWERFDAPGRSRVLDDIGQRIRRLPGVNAAGAVNVQPFSGAGTVNALSVEGRTYAAGHNPSARWRAVTTGYLDAAGIAVSAGRGFREGDRGLGSGDRSVAVVTETMAREIWGSSEAALGKRFAMSANSVNWMRVVGVAEDVRDIRLDLDAAPQFFFPDGGWWPWMTFVIRAEGNIAHLAPAIRAAIQQVDGDLPVPTIEPVAARRDRTLAGPRFNFILMVVFGAVALILALMGVYGVTHLATSRRSKEIGIRLALGASQTRAFGLILGSSVRMTAAGIVLGLGLAAAGSNVLGSVLIRTDPLDPAILSGTAVFLLVTSLLAAAFPAWQAMRVDAASVLRAD